MDNEFTILEFGGKLECILQEQKSTNTNFVFKLKDGNNISIPSMALVPVKNSKNTFTLATWFIRGMNSYLDMEINKNLEQSC